MQLEDMFKMAGQFKDKLGRAQAEAAHVSVTGEAGAGLVRVTLNGRHQVTRVALDPSIVSLEQQELLQDLIRAASNQATEKLAVAVKESMSSLSKEFGLDFDSLAAMARGTGEGG